MESLLIATGVIAIVGGLCGWIWRARRPGAARDSATGYLIADQVSSHTAWDTSSHHHDSGGVGGADAGAGDGGAG